MLRIKADNNYLVTTIEGGNESSILRMMKNGLRDGSFSKHNGKEPGSIAYISEQDQKLNCGSTTFYLYKGFYVVHIPEKRFWFW